jgi:protein-S-isoprenylcysteine O-methyltransferase Ste14
MIPPNDERPPKQRNLRIASFATHATRGILRDEQTRRKVMFGTIFMAVVMLFCGATFLAPVLDPRIRLGWFVVYWLVCAWITVTAVLLAIFDLLLARAQGRTAGRALAKKLPRNEEEV